MHREKEEFEKLGVQAVVIGHSSVGYARAFVDDTKLGLRVFVDEKRVVYRALGFKRSLLAFVTPPVFKRAAEARKEGFATTGIKGDVFQLGGIVLRRPGGTMPYRYESQFAGDHPSIETLKTEVRKVVSA